MAQYITMDADNVLKPKDRRYQQELHQNDSKNEGREAKIMID